MTVERWLAQALADAERRGLPELAPLLESLAASTRRLRDADWNVAADRAELPAVYGLPVSSPPPASAAARSTVVAPRSDRGRPPHLRTIGELAPRLRAREITSHDLTTACLAQIEKLNGGLRAFITVTAEAALAQAREADREIAAGTWRGPLHGIPISLKDLIDVGGVATTAASRVRHGTVATRDAHLVTRLKQAGAVMIGKTNLHEFAFGTTSEDSAFGAARHPLDPSRSPGGSSGGSAAGVAAGMSVASIGTDTGGSIRIPSAACGCVGLKPTFGELSCDGVVPLAWSLDHVGPIARSVSDARAIYRVMNGTGTTSELAEDRLGLDGMAFGIPTPYFLEALDDGVRASFEHAVQALRAAGATVAEVAIPHARDIAPVYLHTVFAEAAAYHAATLEARSADYTPPVRIRLEMARYVLAEDYARAQRGREVLRDEVARALAGRAALVLPTLPIPAPRIGATSVQVGSVTDSVRNLTLRLTQPFNLTGHPAISLPYGRSSEGLPHAVQLVGHHGHTESLLSVAAGVEQVLA